MTERARKILITSAAPILFVFALLMENFAAHPRFEPVPFLLVSAASVVVVYLLYKAETPQNVLINACFIAGIAGLGFTYGILPGLLCYLVLLLLLKEKGFQLETSVAAVSAAYLASFSIKEVFVPVLALAFFGTHAFAERYTGPARISRTIREILSAPEELLVYFFTGVTGLLIRQQEFIGLILPAIFFLSLAYTVSKRHHLPEAAYFLQTITDRLDEVVFETPGASREIAALAVRMNNDGSLVSKKAAYTSALPWVKFSKNFYRNPEKIPAGNEAEQFRKAINEVRETLIEIGEKRDEAVIITSVYENFDGTGMPDGIEGGSIVLEPHLVRVAEKYYTLTSWDFNPEPVSDTEALEEIRAQAGRIYLPEAVERLERLILPVKEESE